MSFSVPPLNYQIQDLEPVLSANAVDYHYSKHTHEYYKNVNDLIKGTSFDRSKTLLDIISKNSVIKAHTKLHNNACQAWNHTFYWDNLSPQSKSGEMSSELKNQMIKDFGDIGAFKNKFLEAATGQFGSGWCWLVFKNGKLNILATADAENPITHDAGIPLIACDVWEHAYLYDPQYVANRKKYVQQFWSIVNWEFVNRQFDNFSKE